MSGVSTDDILQLQADFKMLKAELDQHKIKIERLEALLGKAREV